MTYFNLFSNILITKGTTRILISDLQRNTSELYPLELYGIINELKNKSLEDTLKDYTNESGQFIREYLKLLLEKEYGFITEGDWDRSFPLLSYTFHEPNTISNIFIEINDSSVLDKIKPSIENLEVKHLVIYCHKKLSIEQIQSIDIQFKGSVLNGIEIFSPFHDGVNKDFINKLSQTLNRVYSLVFHSCTKVPFKARDTFRFSLQFIRENLTINACGKVDLKYFSTNFFKISEAINHNSCLHKKIGIDIEGNIKNCPLMPEVYGNINHTPLEEALQQTGFKKYWNLTKDHIETCKDCEFRYICTDCRAYTERTHTDANGLDVSKPLKCGYDPYTGKWEAWSTNPLKEKAINFYKL